MSTDQCRRLLEAYRHARSRPTRVIVLMGGREFFSNGIHLNVIEAADDPAAESWANINAIDDLVEAVLTTTDRLVVAAVAGNAAAGGVMLALAADEVWCRSGAVLNPHYRLMGLYGSEYWTHTLPRRVGPATAERLNAAKAAGGRLIAVGTTSLRLVESAAGEDGTIRPFEGDTAIFITPGYRFRAVDGLMTNFHLPKSTLFMLVSALMGLDVMKTAYAHAIEGGYRFYSYGDSSLLLPDRD